MQKSSYLIKNLNSNISSTLHYGTRLSFYSIRSRRKALSLLLNLDPKSHG